MVTSLKLASPRVLSVRRAIAALCEMSSRSNVGEDTLRDPLVGVLRSAGYWAIGAPKGLLNKPDVAVSDRNTFKVLGHAELKMYGGLSLLAREARGDFVKYDYLGNCAYCDFVEFRWRDRSVEFTRRVGDRLEPIKGAEADLLTLLDAWLGSDSVSPAVQMDVLAERAASWATYVHEQFMERLDSEPGKGVDPLRDVLLFARRSLLRFYPAEEGTRTQVAEDALVCRSLAASLALGVFIAWVREDLDYLDGKGAVPEVGSGLVRRICFELRSAIERGAVTRKDSVSVDILSKLIELLKYCRATSVVVLTEGDISKFVRTFLRWYPSEDMGFSWDWRETAEEALRIQMDMVGEAVGGLGGVRVGDLCCGTGSYVCEVLRRERERLGVDEFVWAVERGGLLDRVVGQDVDMGLYLLAMLRVSVFLRASGVSSEHNRPRIFLKDAFVGPDPEPGFWAAEDAVETMVREETTACERAFRGVSVVVGHPPTTGMSITTAGGVRFLGASKVSLRSGYVQFFAKACEVVGARGVVCMVVPRTFPEATGFREVRGALVGACPGGRVVDLRGGRNGGGKGVVANGISGGEAVVLARVGGDMGWAWSDTEGGRWASLDPAKPDYLLRPESRKQLKVFGRLVSLDQVFCVNSAGVTTCDDEGVLSTRAVPGSVEVEHKPFDRHYVCPGHVGKFRSVGEGLKLLVSVGANDARWSHFGVTERQFVTSGSVSEKGRAWAFPLVSSVSCSDSNFNRGAEELLRESCGLNDWTPEHGFDFVLGVLGDPEYGEAFKEHLRQKLPGVPLKLPQDVALGYISMGGYNRRVLLPSLWGSWSEMSEDRLGPLLGGVGTVLRLTRVRVEGDAGSLDIPAGVADVKVSGWKPAVRFWKDRVGKLVTPDELRHYRRVVRALELYRDRGTLYDERFGKTRPWFR